MLRAFNSLCAALFIDSAIYIMAIGFSTVAMAISVAGAAVLPVQSSEGVLEVITGTVEAMIDGVLAVIEAITSVIASLFS
ncbi:hypothetical protein CXP40_16025 [Pseudomonas sp. YY-1]|nr:hypothetical protein CXP40_16025 [Pseudomonas sp. YY-1]